MVAGRHWECWTAGALLVAAILLALLRQDLASWLVLATVPGAVCLLHQRGWWGSWGQLALLSAVLAGAALRLTFVGALLGAALVHLALGAGRGAPPPRWRALGLLLASALAAPADLYLALLALASAAGVMWRSGLSGGGLSARLHGWGGPPALKVWFPLMVAGHVALIPLHGALTRRMDPAGECTLCRAGVPWAGAEDAAMWLQLGEVLAERGELPHRRPAFAVLGGAVRAWTTRGEAHAIALTATNLVLHALALALLAGIVARAFSRTAWVVTLVPLLLVSGQVALHAMSEPLGLVLLVCALAMWELLPHSAWPAVVAGTGGFLFGASNVTRTFTLPAAPLVILALTLTAPLQRRWRVLGAAVLGLAVSVGPVVVLNRARFGVSTVTLNTADMIWAAAEPSFGAWSPAAERAMEVSGHETPRARNERLLAEALQNLRAHPALYVERCLRRAVQGCPPYFRLEWGLLSLCTPLLVARATGRRRALAGGLLGLGVGAGGGPLEALAGLGLAYLGYKALEGPLVPRVRLFLGLAVGGFCAAVLLAFMEARALLQIEWVFAGLMVLGLAGAPAGSVVLARDPSRSRVAVGLLAALALLAATLLAARRLEPAPPYREMQPEVWKEVASELSGRAPEEWDAARALPYGLNGADHLVDAPVRAAGELSWPLVTYPPGGRVVDLSVETHLPTAYLTLAGYGPVLVAGRPAPTGWSGRRVLVLGRLRAGTTPWVDARVVVPLDWHERPRWEEALWSLP